MTPVSPTLRALANIDTIASETKKEPYSDFGSVEGVIDTISVRDDKDRFDVYNEYEDRRIECKIQPDQLQETLVAHRKCVSVFGLIGYSGEGIPLSIQVKKIRVLSATTDPTVLKKQCKLKWRMSNPAEAVRGVRDGW